MWVVAFLSLGLLSLLVASEQQAINVDLVPEYRHQDSDFSYLVKRYLRRVLLPNVVNEDGENEKKVTTVYDDALNPEDRHLRVAATSYFDTTASKWIGDDLSRAEPPDPDFWDIVAWLGTQIGRGIRTLFDGLCKLSRAIYAGILYGWQSEGAVSGMNATTTITPTP